MIPIGQPLVLFHWRALGASRLGDYSSFPWPKVAVNLQAVLKRHVVEVMLDVATHRNQAG